MKHTLCTVVAALLLTACEGHETPGSADPVTNIGDEVQIDRNTGAPELHRTAQQIVSAQIRAAVLDWRSHQVIGPDDVDDYHAGTYIVEFPSGALFQERPGYLRFAGHGLEGLDTEVLVSFSDDVVVTTTDGELPGFFSGPKTELHYSTLEGELVLDPAVATALVEDTMREPLVMQLLIRSPGAPDDSMIECDLLGVRVIAPSRGEVLLEGVPAQPLRR